MNPRPALRPDTRIGTALIAVAREILAEARAALANRKLSDAARIHDFRKALKRWRALLRLLEPPLGKSAKALRMAARDLAQQLARTRDAQSALDALADIEKGDRVPSPRTVAAMSERLHALKRRRERATLNTALRRRMRARITSAERAVGHWMLDDLSFDDVAGSLTETYRRARRAIPKAWKQAPPEALHELRKRVVEHRYQMELVESLWPRFGKLWVEETQRLRDRLGTYQDLAVLTRLASPHQPLAPWRARLRPLIVDRQARHAAAARRIAGNLFAERPKAFRRRIRALWSSRDAGA
jgi:CHAD domain-containing protein